MRKLQWLSISFIFIGVLFLGLPFFQQWTVTVAQDELEEDWEQLNLAYAVIANNEEPAESFEEELPEPEPSEDKQYREDILQKGIVGQLKIPAIEVDVMVVPGVEKEDLDNAAGWITSTSLPEEGSNMAIAGHRSHTYGKFFHRMGEVVIGDEIHFKTLSGNYTFEVYDILVVDPEEVWVLDPTEATEITLITCEPLYSNEYRLIIKAKKTSYKTDSV
ncbi:class D sortase [Bacillus solitudinis]|uniref:class D sortase n=1 Tax=Bacillus solitudinis TaxID=2014074 RepID=UPI000C243AF2|nr:class D sortase [Bacillus solitudinis]